MLEVQKIFYNVKRELSAHGLVGPKPIAETSSSDKLPTKR